MLTVVFMVFLALAVMTARHLRSRSLFAAARLCLWFGLTVGLLAFKVRWIPSTVVTFTTYAGFFIYVLIQDMRIHAEAGRSRSN